MQKARIALLCCLLTPSLGHARFFSAGPRVGVHIAPYQERVGSGNTERTTLQREDYWGYHVGVFARTSLFLFYVQPEIILTNAGIQYRQGRETIRCHCTKLDIPAMVGLTLLRIVRVQAGPILSVLVNAKEGNNNITQRYRSVTVGWQAGLGIDIWKIGIDLKYEGSLNRLGNTITGIHPNHRHAPWVVSIGIKMF